MKKGLRRLQVAPLRQVENSNRRPDEEGIKTTQSFGLGSLDGIPTADLMKKGLRHPQGPDLRSLGGIPTADLMKKGLRHVTGLCHDNPSLFQPQT